jgi:hypothetical protein
MVDNRTKKVAHTTNNKDRRLLPHDVESVGGIGGAVSWWISGYGYPDYTTQRTKRGINPLTVDWIVGTALQNGSSVMLCVLGGLSL